MHPLKREVRFVADHLPMIAIMNLITLKYKVLCSCLIVLSVAVTAERGGESRGCLSSEFDASFAIDSARDILNE